MSRNYFVARSVARSRTRLYFSQRIAATGNTIAQCIIPPATFTAILTRAHAHTSCFSFRGALRDKLLRNEQGLDYQKISGKNVFKNTFNCFRTFEAQPIKKSLIFEKKVKELAWNCLSTCHLLRNQTFVELLSTQNV